MKRFFVSLVVLAGLSGACFSPAWGQNPFTSKPGTVRNPPSPPIKSRFFVKIIFWQHQLKQELSKRIRAATEDGTIRPFLLLTALAFLYGMVHAAGPGHGKFVAVTYALSHRVSLTGGLLLGVGIAVVHGFSGVIGVLGLRYVIQRGVSDTLASVTQVTQMVSFSLITLMGIWILVHKARLLWPISAHGRETGDPITGKKSILSWALVMGLVPCPAVVMTMLFCISMDAALLGLVLAGCISLGMGVTISGAVLAAVLGKSGVFRIVPGRRAALFEGIVGVFSGIAITGFGALFLMTTIHSAFY